MHHTSFRIQQCLLVSLLIFFALVLSGCPTGWPDCQKDQDCSATQPGNLSKKRYYCVHRKCQQCKQSSHCGESRYWKCASNICIRKTCKELVCPMGKVCTGGKTPSCGWACQKDGETPCQGDPCKICFKRQCVLKPPKCIGDLDCPGKFTVCRHSGTCKATCSRGCSPFKKMWCEIRPVRRTSLLPRKVATGVAKRRQLSPKGRVNTVKAPCQMQDIYFPANGFRIPKSEYQKTFANKRCIHKSRYKLLLTGHADDPGTLQRNMELSKRRALITSAFLEGAGLKPSRMCTAGEGKSKPAHPRAKTQEERRKNRRVVFTLVRRCP